MITKRIIPCLDVKDGRVVKGVNFAGLQDMADPVEMARYYNAAGADELVFYDITASVEGRTIFTDILRRVASGRYIAVVEERHLEQYAQRGATAEVSMTMNGEGTQEWARLTGENIGKCIAIVLDGYVYSAPRVNTKIDKGSSQITGDFTIQEAKDLANVLNSGKVPAPAKIIQDTVVGPSLGQESINAGMLSFVIAFILVLAGGIGNLIDRVLNGEVVDYINPLFIDFAVFNFADILVCVGVALWVLVILLEEVEDKPSKER